jgi:hypothetical protein
MKKLLTILFFSLTFTLSVHAQMETFQKLYLTEHFTLCFDVVPTPDRGYLMTGFEDRPAPFIFPLTPFLCKIDCTGEVEWMKKYGVSTNIDNTDPRVAVLDAGDYMMMSTVLEADYDILVTRTTPDGETVWSNTYGGPAKDVGRGMLKLEDDNIVVVGSTQSYGTDTETPYSDMYMMKISGETGDTIWTQTLGLTEGIDDLWAVAEGENGDLTFVGRSFFSEGIFLSLIRTNAGGKVLWSKVMGRTNHHAQAFDIQRMDNNDFVITGMTTLAKQDFNSFVDVPVIRITPDGEIVWAKILHGSGPDLSEIGSSLVIHNGVVAVALESTSYPTQQPDITKRMIYQLDVNTGALLYAKMFNDPGGQFPMIRKDHEGFIMSGFTDEFPGSWNDPILTKLDDNFDSGCNEEELTNLTIVADENWDVSDIVYDHDKGAVVSPYMVDSTGMAFRDSTLCFSGSIPESCEVVSSIRQEKQTLEFSAFPNPTSGYLEITLPEITFSEGYLEIFNLQGQRLDIKQIDDSSKPVLELDRWPAGVYMLKLQLDQLSATKLIEKF